MVLLLVLISPGSRFLNENTTEDDFLDALRRYTMYVNIHQIGNRMSTYYTP
jgi:hypothetical protein